MITVAILINGQPIVARNAINQVERNEKGETMMVSNMKKQKELCDLESPKLTWSVCLSDSQGSLRRLKNEIFVFVRSTDFVRIVPSALDVGFNLDFMTE